METTEGSDLTKWAIDQSHSEISFKVIHLMLTHFKGVFKIFDATICTTGKDFTTSKIDLLIDASTIDTGDMKRDNHLKGRDFFDVEKHRQITFTSGKVSKADKDDNHELWGDLTMMGITNSVKLNIQFHGILNYPWESERAGFTVTGKINKSDWGFSRNNPTDSSGLMVNDEVEISCEFEFKKPAQKIVLTPDGMDTFFKKVS